MSRKSPNILVTGTPGVGKSKFSSKLSKATKLKWLDISKYAKENECIDEFDEEYNCPVLDEDKLLDNLEEIVPYGGYIIDYHSSELFPKRWIDKAIVLTVGNTVLYDRLRERGYSDKKLEDNIDCEIFQTILEETRASYDEDIIEVFENVTRRQMTDNIRKMTEFVEEWQSKHSENNDQE